MRLIDIDALRKPIYAEDDNVTGAWMSPCEQDGYNSAIDEIWERIQNAPTVDAVPVVRCKDCRWRGREDCAMSILYILCGEQYTWESDNDFCSYGERLSRNENEPSGT